MCVIVLSVVSDHSYSTQAGVCFVLLVVSDHSYSTQAGVCYCVKCCVRSFLQYSGWCVLLC